MRERTADRRISNTVEAMDYATGALADVVRTPSYESSDGDLNAYTDAHRMTSVFWHHDGRGVYVLVEPSVLAVPFGGTPPSPSRLQTLGVERAAAGMYFVPVTDDGTARTIDNADAEATSSDVVRIARDDGYWSSLHRFGSYPRR